jgi:CRISPR-associated helicase Cas3
MLDSEKHTFSLSLKGFSLNRYQHSLWKEFPLFPFQYQLLQSQSPTLVEVPCGFGKTFAALIPSLIESRKKTFFVFPSNALVEAQYKSVKTRLAEWGYEKCVPLKLTGDDLLQHMTELNYKNKGEALYDLLTREIENVVFTNIDIMFNILSQRYGKRREIVSNLKSSRVIFDEFHFYKNITAVLLGAMFEKLVGLFTKEICFLSATPSAKILELVNDICPVKTMLSLRERLSFSPSDIKQVMFPTQLEISPVLNAHDATERALAFVSENFDKKPLGMVILDSIRDAIIFARRLREKGFPNVFLYTGLKKEKFEDVENGIIVGTSAIEVGIDKKIDYLFFEANNTTSFLQRFGRVGRKGPGVAYASVDWDLYNSLKCFESKTPVDRLPVLDSLSRNENRFNYVKLYQNSEFKEIMSILDKLYDPEIKLTESEKDILRALSAREGVTVFVRDKKTNDIYLYDVLRIIRDYTIVDYHFSNDLSTIRMNELARQKIEYFSEFSNPLIVEIENLDYPRERKIYPTFDGTIFYVGGGKRALDFSFKNLKEKGLFKRVVQNRVLREEGCAQVRDSSDSRMSWVWGFSSKLV